jgi:DNA-binding protein H-NS
MVSLKGMDAQSLLKLRNEIDQRLIELKTDLEKQLAALTGLDKGKSLKGSLLKGGKVPPKYRSPKGETWAGRGARPRWLVAAMKKGRKPEDFLIKRRSK